MRKFALILGGLCSTSAFALDRFEIQVYQGEHNRPRQFSLEVHVNSTYSGRTEPSYEGELPPSGVSRLTFEPAFGVTDWLEVGAYLQAMMGPDGSGYFGGVKLRAKFIIPTPASVPCTFGVNVELGRVPREAEEDGWANEIRPIAMCEVWRFDVALNPIIGYALSGPDAFQPHLEPAFKAAFNTNLGFGLGVEYYAGLGLFRELFAKDAEREHILFAAFDLMPPRGKDAPDGWELNIGVGYGLMPSPDRGLVVKFIVGHAL